MRKHKKVGSNPKVQKISIEERENRECVREAIDKVNEENFLVLDEMYFQVVQA